jgi:hypothetical protein
MDAATFLMGMNWLKIYDTEHVLAGCWILDEHFISQYVQETVITIQSLKANKVVWGGFDDDNVCLSYLSMVFIARSLELELIQVLNGMIINPLQQEFPMSLELPLGVAGLFGSRDLSQQPNMT